MICGTKWWVFSYKLLCLDFCMFDFFLKCNFTSCDVQVCFGKFDFCNGQVPSGLGDLGCRKGQLELPSLAMSNNPAFFPLVSL